MIHPMLVTSLYAAIAAIFLILLSVNVIRARARGRVRLGDGGQDVLARAIRAQGNFVEYTPTFLVLLALAEAGGLSDDYTHVVGMTFMLGRACHAYALASDEMTMPGVSPFRIIGMICTFGMLGLLSAALISQYVSG